MNFDHWLAQQATELKSMLEEAIGMVKLPARFKGRITFTITGASLVSVEHRVSKPPLQPTPVHCEIREADWQALFEIGWPDQMAHAVMRRLRKADNAPTPITYRQYMYINNRLRAMCQPYRLRTLQRLGRQSIGLDRNNQFQVRLWYTEAYRKT